MKLRYATLITLSVIISMIDEPLIVAQTVPKPIQTNLLRSHHLSGEFSQTLTRENAQNKQKELAVTPSTDLPLLTGQVWQLEQIQYSDDTRLVPGKSENYTIEFLENGQLAIRADCNRVRGSYTNNSEKVLSIELGASTRAACPPGSLENRYLQGLNEAVIYFFKDGHLYLDLKADTGTIKFSVANPTTLTGTIWQLQQIEHNNGTLLVPGSPKKYTIEFLENGQLAIRADCNRVTGKYTQDNNSLSIELGASTLAACFPFSLENEYLQALKNAAIYSFKDGQLHINLGTDAGMIKFAPASSES